MVEVNILELVGVVEGDTLELLVMIVVGASSGGGHSGADGNVGDDRTGVSGGSRGGGSIGATDSNGGEHT